MNFFNILKKTFAKKNYKFKTRKIRKSRSKKRIKSKVKKNRKTKKIFGGS